jgi:hypothetical protein
MADPTYLDRLYNEIGQYGDRLKATFGGRGGISQIIDNWGTTYQPSYSDSIAEQNRLKLQQAKEEYDIQANAGRLSAEEAFEKQAILEGIGQSIQQLERRTGMPTASAAEIMQQQTAMQPPVAVDPYSQYLQENAAALQGPYLPQDQYAAPTREEYQKYFIEGQAPSKAVLVNPPVQRTAMPATQQVQQVQPGAIPMPAEAPQEAMAAPQPRQQGPMTIGQRIAALPYEGDRIDATYKLVEQYRQKVFNDGYQKIASTYSNPNDIASAVKNLKEQIDVNLPMPKRVEESPQYKAAEKNWDGGLRNRQRQLIAAYNAVKESQNLMDVDSEKATLFMRQAMIKPLQSIISSEATQVSDLLVQFQDLLNLPAFAQLSGKSITNPTALFNKYLSLEEKDRGTFVENLRKAIIDANPGRALENAIYTVNSYVDGYNKDINDQVIFPTSPTIARQLGAVQFQPLENRQVKNDLPETYSGQPTQAAPQAVPFGAPPPGAVRIKQR